MTTKDPASTKTMTFFALLCMIATDRAKGAKLDGLVGYLLEIACDGNLYRVSSTDNADGPIPKVCWTGKPDAAMVSLGKNSGHTMFAVTRVSTTRCDGERLIYDPRVMALKVAWQLARSHGHAWGSDVAGELIGEWSFIGLPADWPESLRILASSGEGTPPSGILAPTWHEADGQFTLEHTTGTGRCHWRVTGQDRHGEPTVSVVVRIERSVGSAFAEALRDPNTRLGDIHELLSNLADARRPVTVCEVMACITRSTFEASWLRGPDRLSQTIDVAFRAQHMDAVYACLEAIGRGYGFDPATIYGMPDAFTRHFEALTVDIRTASRIDDLLEQRFDCDQSSERVSLVNVTRGTAMMALRGAARDEVFIPAELAAQTLESLPAGGTAADCWKALLDAAMAER